MKKQNKLRWLPSEIEILRNNFDLVSYTELQLLLLKDSGIERSFSSIDNALRRYYIRETKQPSWTDEDTEFLKSNIHLTIYNLSNLLGFSVAQIIKKKKLLGLSRPISHPYSFAEDKFILDNLGFLTYKQFSLKLNRSVKSVLNRIDYLTRISLRTFDKTTSKWTDDEVSFLKDNYKKYTYDELALQLNKSFSSIQFKLMKLGLKKLEQNKWTDDEVSFLKDNYLKMSIKDISKILDRTYSSVIEKSHYLGLSLEQKPRIRSKIGDKK